MNSPRSLIQTRRAQTLLLCTTLAITLSICGTAAAQFSDFYEAPVVDIDAPSKLVAGKRHTAYVGYRPGSQPGADRLHLLTTRSSRCPENGSAEDVEQVLVTGALPPTDSDEIPVPVRTRGLGRLRLCAYVTSGATVTARAGRSTTLVRPPVSRQRMLRWRISARGIGPVRIGMTVREIQGLTGRTMVFGYGDYRSCQLWSLRGIRGLSFMVAYGRLARVEAFLGRWRSSRSIRIGSREGTVRRRYRGVRSEPHPYSPPGKYLKVGGRKRRMVFETSPGGRVTSFRGGRAREVGYIEGCA